MSKPRIQILNHIPARNKKSRADRRWVPWLFGAILVLIPIWLSELFLPPGPKEAKPFRIHSRGGDGAVHAGPALHLKGVSEFDRKAFLTSFERQAAAAVLPCLKNEMGERGSMTYLARLSRSGRISGVRVIEPSSRKTSCATELIEKMAFQNVTRSMADESLEIEWRFDW